MKTIVRSMLLFALGCSSGCVPIAIDNPPERLITGRVVRGDTGAPVSDARVTFQSRRKYFSLLPWDTMGDAAVRTRGDGTFEVKAKLRDAVTVLVQDAEFVDSFELPPFPESNRLDALEYRLKTKKSDLLPALR